MLGGSYHGTQGFGARPPFASVGGDLPVIAQYWVVYFPFLLLSPGTVQPFLSPFCLLVAIVLNHPSSIIMAHPKLTKGQPHSG